MPIFAPNLLSLASFITTPFIKANTPVIVNKVHKSKPHVRRCFIYVVETSGAALKTSIFQNIAKNNTATSTRISTISQLDLASLLLSSLIERYIARNAIPSVTTPSQSILLVASERDSSAKTIIIITAIVAIEAIIQKTERNPYLLASQPPNKASNPAIPPFTELNIAINFA